MPPAPSHAPGIRVELGGVRRPSPMARPRTPESKFLSPSPPSAMPKYEIRPEDIEWWSLTPAQRLSESEKLWATYLGLGGSLDPEPDTQSPFHFPEASGSGAAHGRAGVHR